MTFFKTISTRTAEGEGGDVLHDDHSGHALYDRDCTGHDAGVVSTASGEGAGGSVVLCGGLRLGDRRGGFKADPTHNTVSTRTQRDREGREGAPEVHILPITNPPLYPATPIRLRSQPPSLLRYKRIIMPTPGYFRPSKARADLECFGSGDREHGVCEDRGEFVEYGLAEA